MVVSQKREVFAFRIYQNSLWSYCGQRNRAKSSKSRVWGCIPATSIESFWVSHLALLCLSFLICKMGIMSPPHTQTGKVLCVMAQNLLYINYFWIVCFLFWFFVVVVVWFFLTSWYYAFRRGIQGDCKEIQKVTVLLQDQLYHFPKQISSGLPIKLNEKLIWTLLFLNHSL